MTLPLPTTMAAGKILLTDEDYACLPDDGRRYEIIEGSLHTSPASSPLHQLIAINLSYELVAALQKTGLGKVFSAPCDLILGQHDIVQPDLFFIRAANTNIIGKANIQGASDLVVEILSPSTRRRDVLIKSQLYSKHGIPHYWIIDPDLDRIETFGHLGGVYQLTGAYTAPERMQPAGFPELSLPLDEIFAK